MRTSKLFVAAVLALAVTQLADIAFCQATGRVSGSVVDATGAVVPGAKVNMKLSGGEQAVFQTVTSR